MCCERLQHFSFFPPPCTLCSVNAFSPPFFTFTEYLEFIFDAMFAFPWCKICVRLHLPLQNTIDCGQLLLA